VVQTTLSSMVAVTKWSAARRWPLAALVSGLLCTLPVSAQEDNDASETAAARSLALDGIKLADAGRCDEAIEKLARAEKLHHAPVVLGRLGECQVSLGRLVEGTETLRKMLREAVALDAPPVVSKARERAAAVLERAKGRIGALHIVVKGPSETAGVLVNVDGQPMHAALLDADRPTDPGEHLVEASAPGYLAASTRVNVGSGDKQHVVLNLEPDPKARTAAGTAPGPDSSGAAEASVFTRVAPFNEPGGAEQQPTPGAEGGGERDLTAAYIAWAAGGAAIAAGSIFGFMAFSDKSDLDKQCPGNVCPPGAEERLSSARSASTAATVLMAIGGGGLVLGTVFYFSAGPSSESPVARTPAARTARLDSPSDVFRARAWVGLGQVGLSGEF
jgi:hypothetical protein